MAEYCETDTPIKVFHQELKWIERSPEAFPKLNLFPDGWDLLDPGPQVQISPPKDEIKQESETLELLKFPGATDSWI